MREIALAERARAGGRPSRMAAAAVPMIDAATLDAAALAALFAERQHEPFVLSGALDAWAARRWTAAHFAASDLGDVQVCVRLHPKGDRPYYEGECVYVPSSLRAFCAWLTGDGGDGDGGSLPARERFVGYADYQDMVRSFPRDALKAVDWSAMAGEARDGTHSTLWLGSEGAHTPTHYDAFGRNIVAQLAGTKRWRLRPPLTHDAAVATLAPSRVPFEESSIFSDCADAGAALPGGLTVDLREGQVLHVPKHYWHTVSTVSSYALSVNTWVDAPDDDVDRLREATVRMIVSSILGAHADGEQAGDADAAADAEPACGWVNPTEELWDAAVTHGALRHALACVMRGGAAAAADDDEPDLGWASVRRAVCTGDAVASAARALRARLAADEATLPSPSRLEGPLATLLTRAMLAHGDDDDGASPPPGRSTFAEALGELRTAARAPGARALTLRDVINAVCTGRPLEEAVDALKRGVLSMNDGTGANVGAAAAPAARRPAKRRKAERAEP